MFLYEQLETLRIAGVCSDIPKYIPDSLNKNFELRQYQINAFENFITYFENSKLRRKPTQTLFHMATGSGKTLIMAGLMLYLYKQGYRNFLFFVNLTNIVEKTKENFLNAKSSKHLFSDNIIIDGDVISIKEVTNFQYSDSSAINICFTTTQGLHSDMQTVKENAVTIDDFRENKVVLISDESHHINAMTKKMSKQEELEYYSWEYTVNRIFESNIENILLEFTATCDISNNDIKAKYENKIIFDYPLKKFRDDKFSKEIKTLRTDLSVMDKALQACMLSQYRLKIFQDCRLSIKPVVLFKAAKIAESVDFMESFISEINHLTGERLQKVAESSTSETMDSVYKYFNKNGISFDILAEELRDEFSEEHCISANDEKDVENKQLLLNSLEDKNNPYRAVFEVKKLDEGWDVLNLFDIVRLYETRQSGGKKISKTTISEAQLIGRGARYCPFQLNDEQPRFQRKYDEDIESPLRICEELYYHCQNDSRYIAELHNALREIGIDIENTITRHYRLKPSFKQDDIYKQGLVFINKKLTKNRKDVFGLPSSVIDRVHSVRLATGLGGEDYVLDDDASSDNGNLFTTGTTIGEIARFNYNIVHKALRRYPVYRFNSLQSRFPNLASVRDFIFGDTYLNGIRIDITSKYKNVPPKVYYDACVNVLSKISDVIEKIDEAFEGSTDFFAQYIRDVFRDKTAIYTDPTGQGRGISQGDSNMPLDLRLDLSIEDWYAFNDNYGTSEEKMFVAYFKKHFDDLNSKYDKVFLLRNERHLAIYSFDSGERFEPDFLLFLQSNKTDGYEQYQIFVEPKGAHLISEEKWKEEFLCQLEEKAVPIKKFVDDNKYRIWGFRFFNHEVRGREFEEDFQKIL